jgi:uncharacterized membrane protein
MKYITLYIQLVCSSCLVQNLDGITVYVQLVWFKTFGWNLPVCSICQYFMSGSKLGLNLQHFLTRYEVDKLKIQGVSIQKFRTRHEEQIIWTYRGIPSKSFEQDMKYWQLEHTGWFHPSFEPDMKNRQVEYTGWLHPKVLYQTLNTDKLNIPSCMFNLSVLHVWVKIFIWNHTVCSTCQYFMSGSKLLEWITLWRTDKLNIQGDYIQKFCTRH